ncbi:putative inactive purple acid phosphatase 1, partial [Dissostichus eleginoides]
RSRRSACESSQSERLSTAGPHQPAAATSKSHLRPSYQLSERVTRNALLCCDHLLTPLSSADITDPRMRKNPPPAEPRTAREQKRGDMLRGRRGTVAELLAKDNHMSLYPNSPSLVSGFYLRGDCGLAL